MNKLAHRLFIKFLLILFGFSFWHCSKDEIEIPLHYEDSRNGQSLPYVMPKAVDLVPVDSLDAALVLPDQITKGALVGSFTLGNTGKKLYFLLDKSNPRAVYYDQLRIDKNYDQNLVNDQIHSLSRGEFISARNYHYVEYDSLFLPFTIIEDTKNQWEELFGKLYFWQPVKGLPTIANFLRDSWRQGEFEFEDRTYAVIVIDDDCNGLMDTRDNWGLFDQIPVDFTNLHYNNFRETTRFAWLEETAFEIIKLASDGSGITLRKKVTELTREEDLGRDNPYFDEPQRPRAARSVDWLTNMKVAQRKASGTRKPILVYFAASWSGPCATMDERTYQDAEVVGLSDKFVCVRIDGDINRSLSTSYNITSYPTTLILDSKSKEISRAIGYQPATEFSAYISQFLKK